MHHKKRWIIVVSLCVLAAVVGCYVFASIKNWENYEQQNARNLTSLRQKTDQALEKISQSKLKRDEKMQQFDQLSASLKESSGLCGNSLLFSWQQSLPANKTKVDDCQDQSKRFATLQSKLDVIIAHLKSEQELTSLIAAASNVKMNPGEADWPLILQQWSTAEEQLRKKNVTKTFESTKAKGIEKLQAIRAAWQALIDANKAKDRAKYEAAASSLSLSYGALSEITQSAETALVSLIASFNESYKDAFKKP